MATNAEKAQVVWWYAELGSIIAVQRRFRAVYQRDPPDAKRIKAWKAVFLETGSVAKKHGGGRSRTSEDNVQRIAEAFQRSPRKSIRRAAHELAPPKSTVHDVVHKRLKLYPYKLQLLHEVKPNDKPQRTTFAEDILERIGKDNDFLAKILYSDEATFHLSGRVNRHNVRIWGSEQPREVMEYQRDSPKVNVWCGLLMDTVIGPFFFAEETVTGITYLDMLEQFVFPQIRHRLPHVFFQQHGAPPHWHLPVRATLDKEFPNRWIGRGGPIPWPPRSPDITPLDFFLWGYVKDMVYSCP